MADWEWPTLKDKFEAIGYLAVPGVISAIEATVPRGKSEQFKKEYDGKFSEEYPYEADKYGLLGNGSPDIIIINNPFKKLFYPAQMKKATFIVGGK